MDLMNQYKCGFNSLTESIDTHTPAGRMFIKIIGIFAEFERENISDRVSLGMEKKAKDGYISSNYGKIPYGYDRELGCREITINPEESEIVKEIFHMYLHQHKCYNEIAAELNMRNIKSSKGGGWVGQSIKYILSNPLYIGKIRYSLFDEARYFEADGKHEAIISEKIFLETQNKIKKMQKTRKKHSREENYFLGTLHCAVCGSQMTTHGQYRNINGREVYYGSYLCRATRNKLCKTGNLSHTKINIAFQEFISEYEDFTVEPDLTQTNELVKDSEKIKCEFESMLLKLIQKEKDIMKLYIAGKIDFDEYNTMLEIIRQEKKSYREKITELEFSLENNQNNTALQKEDIVLNLRENWEYLTNMERMNFLQTYIEAIYVLREQESREIKVKRLEFYKP